MSSLEYHANPSQDNVRYDVEREGAESVRLIRLIDQAEHDVSSKGLYGHLQGRGNPSGSADRVDRPPRCYESCRAIYLRLLDTERYMFAGRSAQPRRDPVGQTRICH